SVIDAFELLRVLIYSFLSVGKHLDLNSFPTRRSSDLLLKEPAEVIELAVNMVTYAREKFSIVQWSAEDASRTELPFLAEIVEKVIDAGATVINLPDTVGYATPEEYGYMFKYITENVPNIDQAVL